MTVSMRVMSAGDGYKYLLRTIAAVDEVLLGEGTPPGNWMGSALPGLGDGQIGAADQVSEAQLQLLIGMGRDPITGKPLGRAFPRYVSVADRISERVKGLDAGLGMGERAEEVARIEAEETERGNRRAVAGFDYTFSVPKSVSVLWGVADAGTQALIAQAHHEAVTEVLEFMEREVAATRTGYTAADGAVAQVDVTGLVATAFDHYDSRSSDPQLHKHVVVSNKVQTALDGRWRSLDGRPMHATVVALSEHYNAVLADRLTGMLGLGWEARDRGWDRNPAWEIVEVGEELIEEFSTRSHDIDTEADRLIAAYVAEHGRRPSAKTIVRLRAQATLATRPEKQTHSLADLTAGWRDRATAVLGEDATGWASRITQTQAARPLRADDVPLEVIAEVGQTVVETVREKRSTWRRWNLHAEASRQSMGWRFASVRDREAIVAMIADAAEQASLRLTPPELALSPVVFRCQDGTSVFRPRHSTVFSSTMLLEAEDRLLHLASTRTGPTVDVETVERIAAKPDRQGRVLGADQADALTKIAVSGRVLDVLVGPAGAGKTTAMNALRRAWEKQHGFGSVVGLAPSAVAAQVLGDDLGIATENTAKWWQNHLTRGDTFKAGKLVIIDEASLAGTLSLDRITALAAEAGAKVLLVGDYGQLQSVDAGGTFGMLVADRHHDAPELVDVHRFIHDWEKTASLDLRHGRTSVIDTYLGNHRITDGDGKEMIDAAYAAWRADRDTGRVSVLIAETREDVTALNARARADLILEGRITPAREATLVEGTLAGVGDTIITRRNERRLRTGTGRNWVRNGETWRITVDTAHVLVEPTTTRENFYVAMTRGKASNRAYVVLDRPDPTHSAPHPVDNEEATGRSVLFGVLQHSGAEVSAHETTTAEQDQWGSIAQLAAEYETIATAAQHDRWATLICISGLTDDQAEAPLGPVPEAASQKIDHSRAAAALRRLAPPREEAQDPARRSPVGLDRQGPSL